VIYFISHINIVITDPTPIQCSFVLHCRLRSNSQSCFCTKGPYENILQRHLNNTMEQRPSIEANSRSANQEITLFQWNTKVHYRAHNSLPLVPILNPVHTYPPYFPKIHYIIMFPSTPRSSELFLPFRFSDQKFVCISHFSMHETCPAHFTLLHLITLITSYEAPRYVVLSSLLILPPS